MKNILILLVVLISAQLLIASDSESNLGPELECKYVLVPATEGIDSNYKPVYVLVCDLNIEPNGYNNEETNRGATIEPSKKIDHRLKIIRKP
jgi:hypothetical protein